MKIGTVPKITVGVIAIVALAFFGSRHLLSPERDSLPSTEVTASTANISEQSVAGIDATRRNAVTASSRAEEPQISTEEMEQVEDFFAQLEEGGRAIGYRATHRSRISASRGGEYSNQHRYVC